MQTSAGDRVFHEGSEYAPSGGCAGDIPQVCARLAWVLYVGTLSESCSKRYSRSIRASFYRIQLNHVTSRADPHTFSQSCLVESLDLPKGRKARSSYVSRQCII
eukprot:1393453-Amorphochlora_amoeboformis.AAC.3